MNKTAKSSNKPKRKHRKPEKLTGKPVLWVTVTNQEYFNSLNETDTEREISWTLNPGARKGDRILLYCCAPVSALVAWGVVASTPFKIPDAQSPWFGHWYAQIEGVELLFEPVTRKALREEFPMWGYWKQPRNSIQVPSPYAESLEVMVLDALRDNHWLCVCGDYTDHCHCPTCLREAPWGCDCGAQEDFESEEDDFYDWSEDPEDYEYSDEDLELAAFGPSDEEIEAAQQMNFKYEDSE